MRSLQALIFGALLLLAVRPAAAQVSGQTYDGRAELTYTPVTIRSGVVNGSMGTFTISGEGRVYRAIMLGGSYSRGTGGRLTVAGVPFSNAEWNDLKIYVKVPLNWDAFAESERTMGPTPAFGPLYAYVGYKNTTLRATSNLVPPLGQVNIDKGYGAGFGLGADVRFQQPLSVYGQFVYYPQFFASNVGAGTPGSFLRAYEAYVGVRTNFGFEDSPVEAKVGYHRESHQYTNANVIYDGLTVGATARW